MPPWNRLRDDIIEAEQPHKQGRKKTALARPKGLRGLANDNAPERGVVLFFLASPEIDQRILADADPTNADPPLWGADSAMVRPTYEAMVDDLRQRGIDAEVVEVDGIHERTLQLYGVFQVPSVVWFAPDNDEVEPRPHFARIAGKAAGVVKVEQIAEDVKLTDLRAIRRTAQPHEHATLDTAIESLEQTAEDRMAAARQSDMEATRAMVGMALAGLLGD